MNHYQVWAVQPGGECTWEFRSRSDAQALQTAARIVRGQNKIEREVHREPYRMTKVERLSSGDCCTAKVVAVIFKKEA